MAPNKGKRSKGASCTTYPKPKEVATVILMDNAFNIDFTKSNSYGQLFEMYINAPPYPTISN